MNIQEAAEALSIVIDELVIEEQWLYADELKPILKAIQAEVEG